jgi:hypothetical protein
MGRHDGVHGSFPCSLPQPPRISDPTPPGMHTTAISHRRKYRSFRRIAPLVAIGHRRRRGIAPLRPMRHPPSPLLRQTRGHAQMQRIRPHHVFDQITPRGHTSCVALAAPRTRSRKRRARKRIPHHERSAQVWVAGDHQGTLGRVERGVPRP